MTVISDLKSYKGHTSVYWNARSMFPKLEEIDRIMDLGRPDFLGINETWLNTSIPNDLIAFDNYNFYRADRTAASNKRGGGGIILYYRSDLKVIQLTEFTMCTPDIECIWAQLLLKNTKRINIGLIYRPPSGNIPNFIQVIEDICHTMRSQYNCEINFGGDININLFKRDANIKRYRDCLKRMGLKQLITDATHAPDTNFTLGLLDHFVTSDHELYGKTGVIAHGASDHFLIFNTRKKEKVKHEKDEYTGRAYSKMDTPKFIHEVVSMDWTEVYTTNDSELAWGLFKVKFIELLDKHAPYKTFMSRMDRQPWVTTEFLEGANERDNKSKTSSDSGNPIDKADYRRTRNRVTSLKRELKRLYFQTSIQESKGDSSKLWKALKKFLKTSKSGNRINSINGKTATRDIVNEINNYFIEIGPKLASNIPPSNLEMDLTINTDINQLVLKEVTVEQVEKELANIPDSKATGDDGIPIRFIKMTKLITAKIICHIINLTIRTNKIPLDWKSATITPLFKDGDKDEPANYRPISILPAISKILERLIHSQLYDHIDTNGLLSDAQFGFRKGHSTSSCILTLLDSIYRNIEANRLTGVIFLDLKKAFDTVDHNILISKLRTFNIKETSLDWFKNYLDSRKQCVKLLNTKSDRKEITCGVPQGSILGPLLFILYINDLEKYLNDCKINLYADDTALYSSSTSYIELMLNLRLELSIVSEWLKANKLTLNVKKTKFVIFGSRHKLARNQDTPLYINREQIERVKSMKYLGMMLDDQLTFEEHIDYIQSKTVQKLGILRKSRDFLDRNTSILLYKSLVLPHFDYCDTVYGVSADINLQKLQKLQNSACRTMLLCDKRTPISEMHKSLELLTLKDRRHLHMSMDCHAHINNPKSSLNKYFKKRETRRTRAGESKMELPNLRSNTGRKAFSFRGPQHWLSLPENTRIIESKQLFKKECIKNLMRDVDHPT